MICPACSTECDDSSTFCQTCGRRVSGGRIPWLAVGCPAAVLLLVAFAAFVALILKHLG